jgi:hypothetical protein
MVEFSFWKKNVLGSEVSLKTAMYDERFIVEFLQFCLFGFALFASSR